MSKGSDLEFSPGCRDRLMVSSSLACIVALFVSILGLARSLFDVTWPLGQSGGGQICVQVGHEELDVPSFTWSRTASSLSSRSPCPATRPDLTITPMPPKATTLPTITPVLPKATVLPTITPVPPKATLGPTITPMLPTPTPVPSAHLTTSMSITTQVVSSATTGHPFQVPILLKPEPDARLQSEVHFQWQWDWQPLPEDYAFDLLIWSEAEHQEHEGTRAYGVVETNRSTERAVDLDFVQTVIDHGGGPYFWTVIVVKEEPYERVGAWGEKRPFIYTVPEPPAEPTAESP